MPPSSGAPALPQLSDLGGETTRETRGAQGAQYHQPYCCAGLLAQSLLYEEQRHRVRHCHGAVTTTESPPDTANPSQPHQQLTTNQGQFHTSLAFAGPSEFCPNSPGCF